MAQKKHDWTVKRPDWEVALRRPACLEWYDKIGPLSVRARAALANANLPFSEACDAGLQYWMEWPNCGRETATEIVVALAAAKQVG